MDFYRYDVDGQLIPCFCIKTMESVNDFDEVILVILELKNLNR